MNNSMKDVRKYYKEEVDRLTGADFMLESLARHCASSINLIDSIMDKDRFAKNNSAKDTKDLLLSVSNNINKLKHLHK